LADSDEVERLWLPVIGRALAHICMSNADMGGKTIAERAQFLKGLGLDVNNAAEMLGTSAASVNELLRRAKDKGKKGGAKKSGNKAKKPKAK
jgi:hypothetical protein